jgi:hypothetical protein
VWRRRGAFFFVSWLMGQFVRISRQQATDDALGTLAGQLRVVGSTVDVMKTKFDELLAGEPALQPIAQEISELTESANTQLAQANSTIAALGEMRILPWDTPWELPRSPKIRGYEDTAFVPQPPPSPSSAPPDFRETKKRGT